MQIRLRTEVLILTMLTALFIYACGGGGSSSSAPPAPTVTTGSAANITTTGATLNGSVNPNGLDSEAWFEWGTDSNLANFDTTSKQNFAAGTTVQSVSAPLTGLNFGTTYYFRMVASSSAGVTKGTISNFPTSSLPPTVTTLPVNQLTTTSATLNGQVNPNLLETSAWFEWGTDPTLETFDNTSLQNIGSGAAVQPISQALSGLDNGTTYYYRMVATNSAGTQKGGISSFNTDNPPPTADAGPDQALFMGHEGTLDGSGSSTPVGGGLTYLWEQVQGTTVSLSDNTVESPTFTAPTVTIIGEVLRFQLTVTDSRMMTHSDNVDVIVRWGFLDDFSSDSSGSYNKYPYTSSPTFTYMPGSENIRVITGDSGLYFDHSFENGIRTSEGVYTFDFYPTDRQGGGIEFTLSDDGSTYYKFSTITGEALKVRGGVVIDNVAFPTSYATYTYYPIKVTFTPTLTVVEAFGTTVNMPGTDPGIPVEYFSVTLDKQNGFFDNFKLEAIIP